MSPFFLVQLTAFFASLVLLSAATNRLLSRATRLDPGYLPRLTWGWSLYLVIYLVGRWTAAPVEAVRMVFTGLAFGIPALALARYLTQRPWHPPGLLGSGRGLDAWTLLFVAGFIAGMIAVGPYLEFPSDPVEYLYRVQAWEKVRSMDYGGYGSWSTRFAAFAEHWVLRPSGISTGDRSGLAVLSALMQGVLLWQFIRLTRLLTGDVRWGWLGGALSLGYFGYSAISFYRYVVLSGPMVSYIAYLEGLILIVAAFSRERWRYLLLLVPVLAFCWYNHEQGTLFLLVALVGIAVLLLVCRYRTLTPAFRRPLLVAVIATLAAGLLLPLVRAPVEPKSVWGIAYVLPLAALRGWTMGYHGLGMLHELYGVFGWLCMIAAAIVLVGRRPNRELDIIAAVSLFPVLLLLNPLAIEVLVRFLPLHTLHRLAYGAVYWILPAVLLQSLSVSGEAPRPTGISRVVPAAVLIVLIAASWISTPPFRGRMRHVWDRPDRRLDGRNLRRTIEYVRGQAQQDCVDPHPDPRYLPIRRYVLSDPYVSTYLLATGYFYATIDRWGTSPGLESPPLGLTVAPDGVPEPRPLATLLRSKSVCYVVLYRPAAPPRSWLGGTTGHWPEDRARTDRDYAPRLIEAVSAHPEAFALVFQDGPVRVYRPQP